MKLIYSDLALITLKEIVDFLNYKWTKKKSKLCEKIFQILKKQLMMV